jgi:hypothetical protein
LLSGQFLHIHTGPGKQHDRTYGSLCAPTVTANDLCIRDLGYFHLKDLQYIQDKEAYYISSSYQVEHTYVSKKILTLIIFKMEELRKVQSIYR